MNYEGIFLDAIDLPLKGGGAMTKASQPNAPSSGPEPLNKSVNSSREPSPRAPHRRRGSGSTSNLVGTTSSLHPVSSSCWRVKMRLPHDPNTDFGSKHCTPV